MAIKQAKVILSIKELDYYIADLPIAEQLLLLARVSERLSKMALSELLPSPEQLEAERLERQKIADEWLFGLETIQASMEHKETLDEIVEGIHEMRQARDEQIERAVNGNYD